MKKIRTRGRKLEHVVSARYGQSTYYDVKVLTWDGEHFVARVWNGNFGPGDNTIIAKITFDEAAAAVGEAAAKAAQGS